ncbi:hypothetical protein HOV17_gp18 [Halorubrum pleomorphic virus 9]|jgi:hypothetical protein|uniref:Uncharacterized protein n=1 Tax=Halorubrum pleomorphic virus 9 TaxID=2126525 RepID=A0A3S7I7J5_9VIRU|nr:hypothetical protein HOV17_gp18 [Halorubrum pleomorphic virus 9]AVP39982.1 hypothetical protein [Halorubrum pleomorphic virus 9]
MNSSITVDRVMFLTMSLVVLVATTQRFEGDIPALVAFLTVVGGVIVFE